jgi:asparagine synthase (glutamine-hydrolysing)
MIAGVFDPRAAGRQSTIRTLAAHVGRPPDCRTVVGAVELATWNLGSLTARLDNGAAILGRCTGTIDPSLCLSSTSKLEGAFALIGHADDGLVLARGRFAGRPCYFLRDPAAGTVVACSRLGPLVALSERHALDTVRVAAMVADIVDLHRSRTPYMGIQRIDLGRTVRVSPDGRTEEARATAPVEPMAARAPDDIADELRDRVFAAVERGLRGCRRVAVLAGGGVDSSGLLAAAVATARRASGPEIEALTLDFSGPGDDRPYMKELANALGIVPLRVRPSVFGPAVRSSMIADCAPVTWPTAAWDIGLGRLARERGAERVLLGTGGDDLFDGSPRSLADRARGGDVAGAVGAAWRLQVPWRTTGLGRVMRFVLRPSASRLAPAVLHAWHAGRVGRVPDWAGPRLRDLLRTVAHDRRAAADGSRDRPGHRILSASHLLEIADVSGQIEVASGCPIVSPFLDDDLVKFVASIPPNLMLHGDRLRGLFRHAMRNVVPDKVRLRPDKAAFEPALKELVDGMGGLGQLRDLASMSVLGEMGIVEPRAFRRSFERAVKDGHRSSEWLRPWSALTVEAFVRAHSAGALVSRRYGSPVGVRETQVGANESCP